MKKFLIFIPILTLLLNCSRDNKIVATFKGGNLKYSELNYYLSKLPVDSQKNYYGSIDNLKKFTEDVALKKIVYQYAKETNIIDFSNIEKQLEIYKHQGLVSYMMKRILPKITASASSSEIKKFTSSLTVKLIWLKTHRGMSDAQIDEIYRKAKYIKKLLDKGEDFGKLANKYTDDLNNYKNGVVGPVNINEVPQEILNIVKNMKVGEICKPVKTSNGYEIIKLLSFDKNKTPNTITFQHILITTNSRSDEESYKTAQMVYEKAISGIDFSLLANKYTEDPSNFMNGSIPTFLFHRVYYPISDAAYKLKIGKISKPIKTKYGFFILKLEGKKFLDDNQLKNLRKDENILARIKITKERYLSEEMEYKIARKIYNSFKIIENYDIITNRNSITNNPVVVEIIDGKNSLKIYYNECSNILNTILGSTFNYDFVTKQERIYENLVYPKIAYAYALRKKFDKEKEFILQVNEYLYDRVYQELINNIKFDIPEPSLDELKSLYESNPQSYFVTKVINGKPQSVRLSFKEAIPLIKSRYNNEARSKQIEKFLNNLKARYELKVYPENLKIVKNYRYYIIAGDEAYYHQKNYKKAIKFYKRASKLEPFLSEPKLKLFLAYHKNNNKKEAGEIFNGLKTKYGVKISDILSVLTNETGSTRLKLIELLGYTESGLAVPHLLDIYTRSTNIEEKQTAVLALGMLKAEEFYNIIIDDLSNFEKKFKQYSEKDRSILKWYLIEALGKLQNKDAVDLLVKLYKNSKDVNEKCFIVEALGNIRDKRVVPMLEEILKKEVWGIRVLAAQALKQITGKEYKVEEPQKEKSL